MSYNKITAVAHSNIALIKYWGKRAGTLNLPAVGSLSITLNELYTTTSVDFDPALQSDRLVINGKNNSSNKAERVFRFMDIVRGMKNIATYANIRTENNFPTGAGLASSASGFAALALAATKAAGLEISAKELSVLARRGSGSAARSVFGGFVKMNKGKLQNGSDSFAEQIADEKFWDIRLLILLTSLEEKKIGSTEGMVHTEKTSSFYPDWISSSEKDLSEMESLVAKKDFEGLGELAEYSALKMHALAISARPALLYWNPLTVELIHEVRALRKKGIPAYVTIDAGPQIKILCLPPQIESIKKHFEAHKGIRKIIETRIGPSAGIVENGI